MAYRATPLHRRSVLAGFAAVAASAVVAAGGGDTAATTTPATTGAAAAATAPPTRAAAVSATSVPPTVMVAPARKVAIEYWHNDTGGKRAELVKQFADRFNAADNGATVADRAFPSYIELVQALQAALAARIQPAVVQIGYGYLRYFAGQIPHTTIEEIAKRDPQGADFLSVKNFSQAVLDLGRVDGVLHGMAYAMSVPMLWYNVDLLRQAGIERPAATWPEVRAQARQIVERTGKQGLYIAESTNFWAYQGFVESNGAQVVSGMGKDARCAMDSTEAIEAMQFVQDMVREKSAVTLPQRQADQSFLGGGLGLYFDSSSRYQAIASDAKFAVGSSPQPVWGAKRRRVPVGGNALFVFGRDAEQQAAAWEWIKFVHTSENMATWARETGYLPSRLGLAESPQYLKPFYDTNPLLRPALDQLAEVVPWASFPGKNGVEAEKELLDGRGRVLNGQDVATTLRAMTQRVNQLIRE